MTASPPPPIPKAIYTSGSYIFFDRHDNETNVSKKKALEHHHKKDREKPKNRQRKFSYKLDFQQYQIKNLFYFSEKMVALNISIYIEGRNLSGQFGCGILKMMGYEKDCF